jgi:ABC-type lipoprotein export system ATPase subunit
MGMTIIMVTHNLELIRRCTRVSRIRDGKIGGTYSGSDYERIMREILEPEQE